jgi:pilus assembly protein CpaE
MAADNSLEVLVSGRNPSVVREIVSMLGAVPNVLASTHFIKVGDDFPWDRNGTVPEALILALDNESLIPEPLRILGDVQADERPPTLVIGSGFDEVTVRYAMYCGARDFFAQPVEAEDLIAALQRIASEGRHRNGDGTHRQLTVVISAKGGAGASFIASNLAHMMSVQAKTKVVLVDLDLQYGVQPLYFDLQANDGLAQAVATVDTLDTVALEGYMLKHKSGLHILANSHNELILPGELSETGVADLLGLLRRTYDQVVIDLSRRIDPIFPAVVEQADHVLVVLEQSLAALQHAKKLSRVLSEHIGVQSSRIQFVLNRWEKNANLTVKDVEEALHRAKVSTLPNDWRCVTTSLEQGLPVLDSDSRAPITRELSALTSRLIGQEPEKKGLIARLTSR